MVKINDCGVPSIRKYDKMKKIKQKMLNKRKNSLVFTMSNYMLVRAM